MGARGAVQQGGWAKLFSILSTIFSVNCENGQMENENGEKLGKMPTNQKKKCMGKMKKRKWWESDEKLKNKAKKMMTNWPKRVKNWLIIKHRQEKAKTD